MAEQKIAGKQTGWAVVAYIIFFLPLLIDEAKSDPFVRFHVKQGLVLLIFSLIAQAVGSVIPFIGWMIILPLAWLASVAFFIVGILNALNGEEKELPFIGSFAKNFKF